jgi:aspartate racemase
MNNKSTIGVIGGMGPYASAHFYNLLLNKSNTLYHAKDNDTYPEIIIDSVPVPDFISNTEKLPKATEMLVDRVTKLRTYGCSVIGMACNTGHLLYKELSDASGGIFVSMIDLVAKQAKDKELKRVGILATATTINMGLYRNSLNKYSIESVYADDMMQIVHEEIIRELIAGKKDYSHKEFLFALTHKFVREKQLDGIILGCTELPLVFPNEEFSNVIDCMDVLADELLSKYYSKSSN